MSEADENTEGASGLMLTDPDGNVILPDQHRKKKAKHKRIGTNCTFFC